MICRALVSKNVSSASWEKRMHARSISVDTAVCTRLQITAHVVGSSWVQVLSLPPLARRSFLTFTTISTMALVLQRQNGRGGVLPTLDVLIQVLAIAKDTCGIPPAQIVLGAAVAMLTMIRVRFSRLYDDELVNQVYLGFLDQQTRLRRSRNVLRGYMSSPRPGVGWETIG